MTGTDHAAAEEGLGGDRESAAVVGRGPSAFQALSRGGDGAVDPRALGERAAGRTQRLP
jgi:hypothetical protein